MSSLADRAIRLRRVELDEYQTLAMDSYADAEVLRFSEGGADPYGPAQIRAMYEALSRHGELYVIDVATDDGWCAVGDAALLPHAVPIVIGRPEYRSRGVGTAVLARHDGTCDGTCHVRDSESRPCSFPRQLKSTSLHS